MICLIDNWYIYYGWIDFYAENKSKELHEEESMDVLTEEWFTFH